MCCAAALLAASCDVADVDEEDGGAGTEAKSRSCAFDSDSDRLPTASVRAERQSGNEAAGAPSRSAMSGP